MQSLIDEVWNLKDIYLYTSFVHYNHRRNMVWSKRTRTFVICRYKSSRFKVVEFLQAFSLRYNVELLNKVTNPSPEYGETERTGSPKTLERALLYVKYSTFCLCYSVFLPFQCLYLRIFRKISLGTIEHISCFKCYGLESTSSLPKNIIALQRSLTLQAQYWLQF